MRYSINSNDRKYVQGYGFISVPSLLTNFTNKYGKNITDTATKFAKTAGTKVLTKSAEATADLIGNKIADKISSMNKKNSDNKIKSMNKENKMKSINETNYEMNKRKSMSETNNQVFIPKNKRDQIVNDLKLF